MGDVLMALVITGFFGLCVGYVQLCGRIIGPDPEELDLSPVESPETVGAGSER